jgi:squalene-hopene/tetraprenyl-beta-curcumene cyclase
VSRPGTRAAGFAAAALALGLGLGFAAPLRGAPFPEERDLAGAVARAAGFLVNAQSPDGAWRSSHYGAFRGGSELTPAIVKALIALPPSPGRAAAIEKGLAYLAAMVRPDGSIDAGEHGLGFPVSTAALAVMAFARAADREGAPARWAGARDAWLRFLMRHQLTEDLGWSVGDVDHGGWGYSLDPPRKPAPGTPPDRLASSNLSSTLLALGALRAAGVPSDHPAVEKALAFVKRAQNFTEGPGRELAFDDGGFFAAPGLPALNKAGPAGTDGAGRERFRSYGSATADGLRALLAAGVPPDDARVTAAIEWLGENYATEWNPGVFVEGREAFRDAYYYYYAWSAAHACARVAAASFSDYCRMHMLAGGLAGAVLARQRPDGSWSNPLGDAKEDDPLVATALAVAVLEVWRTFPPPHLGSVPRGVQAENREDGSGLRPAGFGAAFDGDALPAQDVRGDLHRRGG